MFLKRYAEVSCTPLQEMHAQLSFTGNVFLVFPLKGLQTEAHKFSHRRSKRMGFDVHLFHLIQLWGDAAVSVYNRNQFYIVLIGWLLCQS